MKKPILLIISLAILFFSCNEKTSNEAYLPGFVGASGEIIVVMSKADFDGAAGDALREIFYKSYALLPQAETEFDLVHVDPSQFDRFWKPHRNVILGDIELRIDTQEPSLKVLQNKYAKDQVFVHVFARDEAAFIEVVKEKGEFMLAAFKQAELNRLGALNKRYQSEPIVRTLETKHKMYMAIPKDCEIKVDTEDFLWIDRQMTRLKGGRNHDVQQGFFVYKTPYVSDTLFSQSYILSRRDSMLKAHVPGSIEGSYMTTEYLYYPTYEEVSFNKEFASEVRGLWKMDGEFMGGPFYSISLLNPNTNELVTIDGYAYAPYFDKREYIREVEAIIKTIRFIAAD
ncbi:MAG: DUF4837 family protein [Flavobacteriales bacterium]|nr:DUF4837 family protein [Flavobacteriales bacterium]